MPGPRSQRQPDWNPRVQRFLQWIEKHVVQGYSGPRLDQAHDFVPLSALEEFFEDTARFTLMLGALFPDSDDVNISTTTILERGYIRVFAILLSIGRGEYIESFVQYKSLTDERLPFESRPPSWPPASQGNDFWKEFEEAQWKYCPHTFTRNDIDIHLDYRTILPIVERTEIVRKGGSSKIFKIKIHPEYDKLEGLLELEKANDPSAHTYVVKIYDDFEAEKQYNNETNMFRRLTQVDSSEARIIQFYGSFVQDGVFHVLLQYANGGTLEEYFENISPPRRRADMARFWSAMLNLIRAVHKIHGTSFDQDEKRKGWHQDIKTTNILVIYGSSGSYYDCRFVLADMGLSHYKRSRTGTGEETAKDVGGTREYGAPECHRRSHFMQDTQLLIRQAVDIWSLACIWSEAVVWFWCLKGGLHHYRRDRRRMTEALPHVKDKGCFHDGEKPLPVVRDMHSWAQEIAPANDTFTSQVISMINDMFRPDKYRPEARTLVGKTEDLIAEFEDPNMLGRQNTGWTTTTLQSQGPIMGGGPGRPINHSPPTSSGQIPARGPSLGRNGQRTSTFNTTRTSRVISPEPGPTSDAEEYESYDDPSSSPHIPASSGTAGRRFHRASDPAPTDEEEEEYGQYVGLPPSLKKPSAHTDPQIEDDMEHLTLKSRRTKATTFSGHADKGRALSNLGQPGRTSELGLQSTQTPGNRRNPIDTQRPLSQPVAQSTSQTVPQPISQPVSQLVQNNKPPPPQLTVTTLTTWVDGRNRNAWLPHRELLSLLDQRDHVFLVDDSDSMRHHWADVVALFRVLAWTVKKSDNDGLDLYYSMSSQKRHSKKTRLLIDDIRRRTPQGKSDISAPLGRILYKYQQDLQDAATKRSAFDPLHVFRSNPWKPMTIYVFTDAVWQPGCDGSGPIIHMIETLNRLNVPNDQKQIGVQFICFGNNPEYIAKLRYLDDGLKDRYGRDIVDFEMSNGNAWKMFLGSINRWFDDG